MKLVIKQFHKLSLAHHPDRIGGDTATFQKILGAYQLIGEYIESHCEPKKDDFEEEIARSAFRQFNFSDVKKNLQSFTILIENHLSMSWEKVLTKHYHSPLDRNVNGKHWRHFGYTDDDSNKGDITIGKWHIPKKDRQSKLHIQSSGSGNFLAAHFVHYHLPKLLSQVVEAAKDISEIQQPPKKAPTALTNICKECHYKAKSLSHLKAHMKSDHRNTLENNIPTPLKVLPLTPNAPEPARFKCFICPEYYVEGGWIEHEKVAHSFKCPLHFAP